MIKSFLQSTNSQNGQARFSAISNTVELKNLTPPTVSYESTGHLLIIGALAEVESIADHFSNMPNLTALIVDQASLEQVSTKEPSTKESSHNKPTSLTKEKFFFAETAFIKGFLGHFEVLVDHNGQKTNLAKVATGGDHFDIVLDLTESGCMTEEVPVPGYYPSGRGYPTIAESLQAIPELIGTFDKPKFFRLDTDLCAHSSRGVKGCTACVDACPAGALSSQGTDKTGHKIEINPYLCQGIGTCATSCPTEAISYALPSPTETQTFIERLLAKYQQQGGQSPIVMFYSHSYEQQTLEQLTALAKDNIIPVALDEIASVGIDTWFNALTHGACQVLFSASQNMPATVLKVLEQQVTIAQALLTQLGLESDRISILYFDKHFDDHFYNPLTIAIPPQTRAGKKRERLFDALDCLAEQALKDKTFDQKLVTDFIADVPEQAPFGTVNCDSKDCTLCMSCVSVCPTRALHAKGDSPALLFTEQDCVQCGLCTSACPENVLSLTPRFNWHKESRQADITLHHEPAAHCLSCGKPFAPASMIEMLQDKLRGHSHFATEDKLKRIAMCEDCRVQDLFSDLSRHPEKQLEI